MTPYYADEWLTVYQGDCREVMAEMEPESVHCVVTSPPYWGLRRYGGDARELGREETVEDYVDALAGVLGDVKRVLRDDGTVWLNIADRTRLGRASLIPERVALRLDEDGWFVASTIIWAKGASCGPFIGTALPDGSGHRPDRSHETVLLLGKSRDYFYDDYANREDSEPAQVAHNNRYAREYVAHTDKAGMREPRNVNHVGIHARPSKDGKRGLRTVWQINSVPNDEHSATMPPKLAELCINAGCPSSGVVLDPFAGLGTTGAVAQSLSRRAVLIDLSPDFSGPLMARNADIPLGLGA